MPHQFGLTAAMALIRRLRPIGVGIPAAIDCRWRRTWARAAITAVIKFVVMALIHGGSLLALSAAVRRELSRRPSPADGGRTRLLVRYLDVERFGNRARFRQPD